jgi:hypothetical protein
MMDDCYDYLILGRDHQLKNKAAHLLARLAGYAHPDHDLRLQLQGVISDAKRQNTCVWQACSQARLSQLSSLQQSLVQVDVAACPCLLPASALQVRYSGCHHHGLLNNSCRQ